MKVIGKVKEFDGYNGYIKGLDGKEYLLTEKEIVKPTKLEIDDNVIFEPEYYKTIETEENIARFIRKIEKRSEYLFFM